jgi:hypothetical protein
MFRNPEVYICHGSFTDTTQSWYIFDTCPSIKKKRLNLKSDALEHFDIRQNTNGIKIIVLIKNVVLNVIFKCFGIKYWKEGSECFIFKHLKDQVVN